MWCLKLTLSLLLLLSSYKTRDNQIEALDRILQCTSYVVVPNKHSR